ncbi:hypothetical protein J6590_038367 [Homalodisca vitripennis]|nr:hypothetical protein J6590_038367 [Homalodisca vitripennis]
MPLRDLRRLWGSRKQSAVPADSGGEEGSGGTDSDTKGPLCSLPLLQVWPSQDSPRGEADGQSFVFPGEESTTHQHDSGIESVQHHGSDDVIELAWSAPNCQLVLAVLFTSYKLWQFTTSNFYLENQR